MMSYGSRKRSYDQGGCVRGGGVDLRLRRITSSPSQTLHRRLVRTTNDGRRRECSARRRPSRLYFSHFATRTVYNTVDLYAVYAAIFFLSESRFWATPPAFDAPVRGGGSRRNIAILFGMKKTRMACHGYLMVKNF